MILLPSRGIAGRQRAVSQHRIEIDVFSDWIEACALFLECNVSSTDVVDVLLEEELYEEQEFAREIVDTAWLEIDRRARQCRGAYGVKVDGDWVKCTQLGTQSTVHTFLLTLSLATKYDWWHKAFGSDYNNQGRLFERVTERAIASFSVNWRTFSTGWRAAQTSQDLLVTAQRVADKINSGPICPPSWDTKKAKDLTLDVLWYFPFDDARQGAPYYLIQCASGGDWKDKLKEPDIEQWDSILNPNVKPVRGLSIPFSLLDERFSRASTSVAGFLLDRCRLLSAAGKKADWIPPDLSSAIDAWIKPRVAELLKRSK